MIDKRGIIHARVLDQTFEEHLPAELAWIIWTVVKRRTLQGKLTVLEFFRVDGGLRDVAVELLVDASRNFAVELPRNFKPSDNARDAVPPLVDQLDDGGSISISDELTGFYEEFPPNQ